MASDVDLQASFDPADFGFWPDALYGSRLIVEWARSAEEPIDAGP